MMLIYNTIKQIDKADKFNSHLLSTTDGKFPLHNICIW